MRPGVDVLGRRSRKDLDATTGLASTAGPAHNMPTSFCMANEDELENPSTKASRPGSDSTFGVRSLQETIHQVSPQTTTQGEEEEDNDGLGNGHEARRRSTLRTRPKIRTRDSSRGSVEQAPVNTGNSSPYNPSQADHLTPSMSQSFASLSSQAPLSSMSSSPKSFSNRSFRPSDDDSMDGCSQAIASSEDDDVEPPSQSSIQDSAPELIMPSIKMPSRRPFTERGKSLGKLKVLIAGDTGMLRGLAEGPIDCTPLISIHRCWQDVSHQVNCANLRRHRARGSLIPKSPFHRPAPLSENQQQAKQRQRQVYE